MASGGDIEIRRAGSADAAALAAFAADAFREAFAADNTPQDMAHYIKGAFGESIQLGEIDHPKIETLLATTGGAIAGYVQLWDEAAPDGVVGDRPVEVRRLYVGADWRGTGLARRLMEAAAGVAVELGADTLWLGVWEHNARAQAFYRKLGFERVGYQSFLLGSDRQTDCIFSAPCAASMGTD